jgi:hypothetical protein
MGLFLERATKIALTKFLKSDPFRIDGIELIKAAKLIGFFRVLAKLFLFTLLGRFPNDTVLIFARFILFFIFFRSYLTSIHICKSIATDLTSSFFIIYVK